MWPIATLLYHRLKNWYTTVLLGLQITLNKGLSNHQEVGFNPVMKVTKIIVVFWDFLGAIKKVNPDRWISFGSHEFLLSNVAQQINENECSQCQFECTPVKTYQG